MIDINQCVCIDDFREVAKKVVKKDYFDYIDSGSSNEITARVAFENSICFTVSSLSTKSYSNIQ